jgi:hypothetical protein
MMTEICKHTNAYAWSVIESKPSYADSGGAWVEMTVDELYMMIALIIYFGLVNVSTVQRCWSVKTLYHGLWARSIMPRLRFRWQYFTLWTQLQNKKKTNYAR